MKKISAIILCLMILVAMVGCDKETTTTPTPSPKPSIYVEDFISDHIDTGIQLFDGTLTNVEENSMTHPIAKIVLENGNEIELELYPEKAPITVANFIYLANEKNLYDGLIFHRIIDGFMVQGGDPAGNGTGGPGYNIKGEFEINGVNNDISHQVGVISMARRSYPYDSAGSQFFICVADCSGLDGQYAAFGKVIKGLEHVLALGKVDTDYNDMPLQRQGISYIRVDTRGITYEKPEGAK